MKIHLVSDLHLEFGPYLHKAPKGTDVVIAAGDITTSHNGPFQLREIFGPYVPIIYIAGNHEFYGTIWDNCINDIRQKALDNNVHFLHEGEYVEIDGVTFIGGTLWTNYELYGNREGSMRAALRCMNDFRRIGKVPENGGTAVYLHPQDTLKMHHRTIGNIATKALQTEGKLVIVSHMAPHPKSIHKKYSGDEVNPYYASDLTQFISDIQPDLWVHGHMHDSFDYMVGEKTRIVCNPRGYVTGGYHSPNVLDTSKYENQAFNPNLLIEV